MTAITISSTVVGKYIYYGDNNSLGDNTTGYDATAKWLHDSTSDNTSGTSYLQFSADNASVFRYNQSGSESGRSSNSVWFFTFTKQ